MLPSYRNQLNNLPCISNKWFLFDGSIGSQYFKSCLLNVTGLFTWLCMKSLVHEKSKYSEWKGKTELVLFNTLFAINYIYKISKHRKIALCFVTLMIYIHY